MNQPDHARSVEREDPFFIGQVNARGNLETRVRSLVEAFLRDLVAFLELFLLDRFLFLLRVFRGLEVNQR